MNSSRVEEKKRGSDEYKRKTNVTASADLLVAMDYGAIDFTSGDGHRLAPARSFWWMGFRALRGPDRYARTRASSDIGLADCFFSDGPGPFYHLCNGIRTSSGIRAGFELDTAAKSCYFVGFRPSLTVLGWVAALQ